MKLKSYFLVMMVFALRAVSQDVTYTVTDLGPVPGNPGFQAIGTGVNSQGDVVGIIYAPRRSFVWTDRERVITMLQPPPQYSPSQPNVFSSQWEVVGIDDFGTIYGNIHSVYAEVSLPGVTRSQPLGLLWYVEAPASPMILAGLPLHPAIQGGYGWTMGNFTVADSNINGLAVGSALWSREDWDPNPHRIFSAPVAWQGTAIALIQPAELGLTEQWEGSSTAISDDGHIVGYLTRWTPSAPFSEYYIFLSYNGMPATRLMDTTNFYPIEINNNGEIIGGYNSGPAGYGYRYWSQETSFVELSLIPYAMNNLGQVVGNAGSSGVIWHYDPETGEGVRRDLNTLIAPNSGFTIVEARGINDDGLIVGQAWVAAESQYHAVLLTPGSPQAIAVDANRDGEITFDGEDETTPEKPFRFWVNDDNDELGPFRAVGVPLYREEDDVAGLADCMDQRIDCRRDLEDFARIHIKPPPGFDRTDSEWSVKINFAGVSEGNPALRLWLAVNSSQEYLTDSFIAGEQIASPLVGPIFVEGGREYALPLNFFQPNNQTAHLLFEGVRTGRTGFVVRFYKGNEKVSEGKVFLNLKPIEELYERYSVGEGNETEPGALQTLFAYPSAPATEEEMNYVLLVLGWNVTLLEKNRWAETTYKRLWHQGFKGRFGTYQWPCLVGGPLTFDPSDLKAWKSAAGLRDLLLFLNSGVYQGRIRVLAHSQGNVVTGEALKLAGPNSRLVHTYVATQAAVSARGYDISRPDNHLLVPRAPDVFSHYWRPDLTSHPETWPPDTASYFHTDYVMGSVGKFVNFFNEVDFALALFTSNQRVKPARHPDYFYHRGSPRFPNSSGFYKYTGLFNRPVLLNFPGDRYEMFSFAVQVDSFALGAQSNVGGVFSTTDEINLQSRYQFAGHHRFHSGQFRSNIQSRWPYWRQLLESFDLD